MANDLVPGETNDETDIFRRDFRLDSLTRVISSSGQKFDRGASWHALSDNGQFLLFVSSSTNVVPGQIWDQDLYLYELATGQIKRITERLEGSQDYDEPFGFISSDGRFIGFQTYDPHLAGEYVETGGPWFSIYDQVTNEYDVLDTEGAEFLASDITLDGTIILFSSSSERILPGIDNLSQVFLYNRTDDSIEVISTNAAGDLGNNYSGSVGMSDDGRYVLFRSLASNLIPGTPTNGRYRLYVKDLDDGSITRVDKGLFGQEPNREINDANASIDGRFVVFSSEADTLVQDATNAWSDVFLSEHYRPADADNDVQTSEIENAAPNNGDGNNDGILDSEQANGTSLPNSGNGE